MCNHYKAQIALTVKAHSHRHMSVAVYSNLLYLLESPLTPVDLRERDYGIVYIRQQSLAERYILW